MTNAPNPVPADPANPVGAPSLTPEAHAVELLRRVVTEAKRAAEGALRSVESVAHLANASDVEAWLKTAVSHLGGALDAAHTVEPGVTADAAPQAEEAPAEAETAPEEETPAEETGDEPEAPAEESEGEPPAETEAPAENPPAE